MTDHHLPWDGRRDSAPRNEQERVEWLTGYYYGHGRNDEASDTAIYKDDYDPTAFAGEYMLQRRLCRDGVTSHSKSVQDFWKEWISRRPR